MEPDLRARLATRRGAHGRGMGRPWFCGLREPLCASDQCQRRSLSLLLWNVSLSVMSQMGRKLPLVCRVVPSLCRSSPFAAARRCALPSILLSSSRQGNNRRPLCPSFAGWSGDPAALRPAVARPSRKDDTRGTSRRHSALRAKALRPMHCNFGRRRQSGSRPPGLPATGGRLSRPALPHASPGMPPRSSPRFSPKGPARGQGRARTGERPVPMPRSDLSR